MGHVLPESLKEAGAEAVFLNHAKTRKQYLNYMQRSKEQKNLE